MATRNEGAFVARHLREVGEGEDPIREIGRDHPAIPEGTVISTAKAVPERKFRSAPCARRQLSALTMHAPSR
jgi:hypothetical protein